MALSKAASSLLAYLRIYKLTPTDYSNRLASGDYTQQWVSVDWFSTAIGRVATTPYKPSLQKGLFKTALTELLNSGY